LKSLIEKVKKFIDKNGLVENGDTILVALSGGPDSVAMLLILNQLRKKYDLKISAAHLNHSLRGKDSDEDEKFVKRLCKTLQIELHTSKVNVKFYSKAKKIGIEEASRELRYEFLNRISKETKASKIATAHTADDNIETVLLNIVRGTGLKGIAGIPLRRNKIIRPILCLSKEEILKYLDEVDAKFRIDNTNKENIFRRNIIRNKVVSVLKEINPNLPETLLRFSHLIRQYEKYFDSHTKQMQGFITESGDSIVLDISKRIDYFETIMMHLLVQRIEQKFDIQPTFSELERVMLLKTQSKGTTIEMSGGLKAVREERSIVIKKSNGPSFDGKTLHIGKRLSGTYFSFDTKLSEEKHLLNQDRFSEVIDFSKVKHGLFLRKWKMGDKIQPLGMKGMKKVSDLLTNSKILHSVRKNILVLCDGSEIIWVCGVRLSDKYKISKSTRKFLHTKIRYEFELQ